VTRFLWVAKRACSGVDQGRVDLLLQQGVVAGELRERIGAQAVAARIAHMPDQGARALENTHDQGGAHAGVLRVGVGGVEDGAVGVVGADFHGALEFAHIGFVAAIGHPAAEFGLDEGGGHGAGDFARVVAAHAIGEHGNVVLGFQRHSVLVVVPHAAGVAQAKILIDHGCWL